MNEFRIGVGLRPQHYPYLNEKPDTKVQWFEAISENYMDTEGRPLKMLQRIRLDFPLALHGVSLSIGAASDVNLKYLKRLKNLVDIVEPIFVSDHLCWTGMLASNIHDLLPFPFTTTNLKHIVAKVDKVQNYLKRPILMENVSSYLTFKKSTYTEWEFGVAVAKASGCKLLLDINNVYVNSQNHGFDPMEFIESTPPELIGQIHLAGFTDMGTHLFDTHSKPVFPKVWDLYKKSVHRLKHVPILVEWDDEIPEFHELEREALKAKEIWDNSHGNTRRINNTAKANVRSHIGQAPAAPAS